MNEFAQEHQKRFTSLEEVVSKIQSNITNSRKVKNYLKGIRRELGKLKDGLEQSGDEYLNEDWIKKIVEVEFVKYFLPEEYLDIQMSVDIYEYLKKYKGYAMHIILDSKYGGLLHLGVKEEILNYIIYELDTVDFLEVRTQKDKFLSELRGENSQFSHINEYVRFADKYSDYEKILELYDKREFKNETDKEIFIKSLLKSISKISTFPKADNQQFLELSEKVIEVLKNNGLSEKQRDICIYEGKMIIRKVIIDNIEILRSLLYVFYDFTRIDRAWRKRSASDIDEFYETLKEIDGGRRFAGINSHTNNLLNIEKFYSEMKTELEKNEYKVIGVAFEEYFVKIHLTFSICKIWDGIRGALSKDTNNVPLFEKYFILEGVYSFTNEVFKNNGSIGRALDILNDFYDSIAGDYESKYSLLLYRVLYNLISLYEENSFNFELGEINFETILHKIEEVAEKVCELDLAEEEIDRRVIDKIKIGVYKLKNLYKINSKISINE